MPVNPIALRIRAKKLGILIRDARLAAEKDAVACAAPIGVTEEEFESFETGERSPSLPQLEVLAILLGVPLEHFWGDQTLGAGGARKGFGAFRNGIGLRNRMIGALLRKARQEAELSIEDLAERAWTSPNLIEAYELGEIPVPLPDLEVITGALNRSINEFQDQRGPAGAWSQQQRVIQAFLALPPELQAFASKSVNRPYLELAQRLSEMSVEKLRAVAEGLLEITL